MTWGSQGRVPLEVVGELRDAQHEALWLQGLEHLRELRGSPCALSSALERKGRQRSVQPCGLS